MRHKAFSPVRGGRISAAIKALGLSPSIPGYSMAARACAACETKERARGKRREGGGGGEAEG